MRTIFIVLLAAHGLAHLPGFVGGWRLANLRAMPYHTTVFAGPVDIGDAGMRIARMLELLLAIGFEVAQLTPWRTHVWDYTRVDGMMVPTNGVAEWDTPTGALPYWRGRLFDFTYAFAR